MPDTTSDSTQKMTLNANVLKWLFMHLSDADIFVTVTVCDIACL